MINKWLRIDARVQETEEKRRIFEASIQNLKTHLFEKARPKNLLKDHPKLVITSIVSGVSLIKLISGFLFGRKSSGKKKASIGSWPLGAAALAGKIGFKFFMPLIFSGIKFALKKSFGK